MTRIRSILFAAGWAMSTGAAPAAPEVSSAGSILPDAGNQVSFAGCARQADGKVVLASTIEDLADGRGHRWIALSRIDERGRLDEAFGRRGTASLQLAEAHADAVDLAIREDGKIVVAGNTRRMEKGSKGDLLAARFLASGELDRSFQQNGWQTWDLTGDHDRVSGLVDDGQGGLFLAGSSLRPMLVVTSRYDFAVARISEDGNPDARFGNGGKAFVRVGSVSEDEGRAVAAIPGNGVAVAGFSRHSFYPDFTVVRLTAAGSRDLRFGTFGWKIIRLSEKGSQANGIVLQRDGKLVAGGDYYQERKSPGSKAIVVRLLPSGAFDNAFGTEGIATLKLPDGVDASVLRLALQGDGRIIAAGVATGEDSQRRILVARLLPDGRPDNAFGTKGTVLVALEGRSADVKSVIAQPDGRILVCGQAQAADEPRYPPARSGRFLLRFEADGTVARAPASP